MHFSDLSASDQQKIRLFPQVVVSRLDQFLLAHGVERSGVFVDFVLVGSLATPTGIGYANDYSDIDIVFAMDRNIHEMIPLQDEMPYKAIIWATRPRNALPDLECDRWINCHFVAPQFHRERTRLRQHPASDWGFSLVDDTVYRTARQFREAKRI